MKNKEICKGMLERLLDQKISDFNYLEVEKALDQGPLSKSVRLDVYVESEEEVADLKLKDGTHILFFYTKGSKGEISKELKALFKYIEGIPSEDSFVKLVDEEIQQIKNNARWRRAYMMQRDYRIDYIEQGKDIGRKEEKLEMVKSLLGLGTSIEVISKASGLSLDEIQQLAV